jgi:hypothetical protein
MPRRLAKSSRRGAAGLNGQLSEIAHSASEQVQTISEELLDHVQNRPLAALVTAFGAGFLIDQLIRRKRH